MLVSGIKSRPVYGTLSPHATASLHLMVADGEGAAAILDLARTAPDDFFGKARQVLGADGDGAQAFECEVARGDAVERVRHRAVEAK